LAISNAGNDIERLDVMRVAIDALDEDRIAPAIEELVESNKVSQIVLVRWWDFMRARRDLRYRACLRDAALVLPVDKSIVFAARLLRKIRPVRHMPFDFVIRVLGALEDRGRSVYLLGGTPPALRTVEQNLRETFPGLRFVGRYTGNYGKHLEPDIITAIRKANPDFVLIGTGIPAGDRWVSQHRMQLGPSIFLYCAEVFDVFAERRRRGSRRAFRRGFDFVPWLIRRPWRLLRFLVYLWFLFTLGIFKLFRL
jgi:N-acetylglucosaminyldiphosphoundecaprenol N-acetyl-beta-D-mannosaminyltransferase